MTQPSDLPPDDDVLRTTIIFRRARGGDRQARDELVRRLLPRIERFIDKECGEAIRQRFPRPDLVQQTVLKTLHYLPDVEGDKRALAAYIYRVARNVVVTAGRTLQLLEKLEAQDPLPTRSTVSFDVPDPAGETPSQNAIKNEERALLRAALGLLEPHYQEVLIRVRLLEEPLEDVARSLNEHYDAVRVRCHRAYQRLEAIVARIRSGQLAVELAEDPAGTLDEPGEARAC